MNEHTAQNETELKAIITESLGVNILGRVTAIYGHAIKTERYPVLMAELEYFGDNRCVLAHIIDCDTEWKPFSSHKNPFTLAQFLVEEPSE